MTLRDKMLAVIADVNASVAEREELVEMIAIALLTRKNLFVLGEPGQAKSYAINLFRRHITGARQFERLLSKQSDEEQLFGRVDLASLLPGSVPPTVLEQDATYQNQRFNLRVLVEGIGSMKDEPATWEKLKSGTEKLELYRAALSALHKSEPTVQTAGKIPEADIVLLDEIFKCNDGVLNSLLTALNERKYDEAARDDRSDAAEQQRNLSALRAKIARRQAEQYQSKFTQALADISAKVKELGARYQRETAAYKAFHAGMECPTCHRPVTEQSLSEVQAALKKVISDLYAAGTEQRGQLTELQEMDKKAADTFEQFKADDLAKWQAEAAELEQACTDLSGSASKEVERLRMEIQTLSAELDYGNLTQPEYDRLAECRKELQQCEAKLAALEEMVAADRPNFDKEIQQARDTIGEIKRSMTDVVSYICKRAELTFSQLKMNKVEISLYDVVKSTGEAKDTFKFTYGGRRYDRLSLSEKIRAGMEISELMKRLTGRNYPVFVDNMESVDDLANVRPTGQIIMAKCIANTALQVRPVNPIIHMEQKAA